MKISQKLLIGFLGSSLIVAGYAFFSFGSSSNIKSQTKKVIEGTSVEIETAMNISESLESVHQYTEKSLVIEPGENPADKSKEYQELTEKELNQIIVDLTKGKQATVDETKIVLTENRNEKIVSESAEDQAEDLQNLEQLTTELSLYQRNLRLFFKRIEENALQEAQEIYADELRENRRQIKEIIAKYQERSFEEINESQEDINRQIDRSLTEMQIYALFAIGISLGIYIYLYRSIYSPIKQLKNVTEKKLINDLKVDKDDPKLKGNEFEFLTNSYELFEKSLHQTQLSTTYFRKVLGSIKYALIILSPELTIKQANQGSVRIFGYSQDELKGQHINFIIKDMSSPTMEKSSDKTARDRSQIIGVTKENKEIYLALSSTLLFDDREEIDSIVCVVRDITEEYLAEKELREREQRYSLAATADNRAVWEWNMHNNQVYYSPHWKSMLGYQDSEIGETIDDWYNLVHPDYLEKFKAEFEYYLNNSTSQFNLTYKAKHKNGNYRWIKCRATSIKDSFGRIDRIVGSQTDITETKELEEKLYYESLHDPLTNLQNRTALNHKLQELSQDSIKLARENDNRRLAAILIDINSFRSINDSLGHAAGDLILKEFAKRLTASVSYEESLVARLGGDQFAIIIENIKNEREAKATVESLLKEIENPFKVDRRQIFVTASIGIALSCTNYENLQDILRDSETAMYCAKKSTETSYVVFEPSMHLAEIDRLDTENFLYQAIEKSNFTVCYQAINDLFTKQISGFEAVMRWQNKEKGLISLDSKMAAIDNPKLLVKINWLLIENACIQMGQWQEKYCSDSPLFVYINLCDDVFFQEDLSGKIARILQENKLQAYNLQLAITSTTIQKNSKKAKSIIKDLKSLGLTVVLNDSGKGYLSLSDLYNLPIDALKINSSLVEKSENEPERFEFMRALISLASSLNIKTIASGVEKHEQSKKVLELNYQYGQGAFFSGIQTADIAEALIVNQKSANDRNFNLPKLSN